MSKASKGLRLRQPTNSSTDEFGRYLQHPKDGRLVFVIDYDEGKIIGMRWAGWDFRADQRIKDGCVFNLRWQAKAEINRQYPPYKAKLSPAEIESLKSSAPPKVSNVGGD